MDNVFALISEYVGPCDRTSAEPYRHNRTTVTAVSKTSRSDEELRNDQVLGVSVMCFSKDRPYQLCQLLLSLKQMVAPVPDLIVVLYAPGEYTREYDYVFEQHPDVTG